MASDDSSESTDGLVDRPRGFLTKGDKEFLRGASSKEMTKNTWNQRRFQIRRRARNAIIDFILLNNLPDRDIELIFGNYDDSTETVEEAVVNLLAGDTYLTYGLTNFFELLTIGIGPSKAQALFLDGLTSGVDYLGARSEEVLLNYETHDRFIIIQEEGHVPLDQIQERFEEGEEISGRELEILSATGRITPEEHMAKYEEMVMSGFKD